MWKKYYKKYSLKALVGIGFLSIESFCDVLQPTLLALVINQGVQQGDLSRVTTLGLMMLGVTLIGALGASVRNLVASHVAYSFGADLRNDVFEKTLTLSKDQQDHFGEGSLMTRLTNDIVKVQDFVQGIMRIFLKAPLIGIASVVMTLRLNPMFWRLYAVVIPIVMTLIVMNIKYGYPKFSRIQAALDGLNRAIQSQLAGIRVVKAFNTFDFETQRFNQKANHLRQISKSTYQTLAAFPALVTLSVNMAIVYILWQGSAWVFSSQMAIGDIMAIVNYQFQFLFALIILARVFARFVSAKASVVRLEQVMGVENTHDLSKNLALPDYKTLVFDHVSFAYVDGTQALTDLCFTIKRGQRVGVIGPTGSGKTSLVHLLMGFYTPTQGQILLNHQDLNHLNRHEWRSHLGYVPQKNMLFSGTILHNIKWGNPQASDNQIRKALKQANILNFVNQQDQGLHTLLGRGGVNVSGGQKQRLSLARALVKAPSLLILDDSTSAVDTLTESMIKSNLRSLTDTTVIMIAQRISSIMDADLILVMDQGHLIDRGSHATLMATCKLYQEIYASQLGSEDLL